MKTCTALFLLPLILFAACAPNNVTEDPSLEKHFKAAGAEGTFALLDNGTGEFTVYNLSRYRDSAYLPASTFKIVNSLIGLQTGKIVNDSMRLIPPGLDRAECNREMSMRDAFRISCANWYQEVARRIGQDTMRRWIDSLAYGNKKISYVDSFWLDNSLKITPDEQMGLVKKLYFNQLPFHKHNQETVKRAMLWEDNTQYKLSYKTGWGFKEDGKNLAWCVGWIEENGHPYFFVLNMEMPGKPDLVTVRMKLLKDLLGQLGFFKGKM